MHNRFEKYDFEMEKWVKLPEMNYKRDELAALVGPDFKIYAIGGFSGREK